VSTYREIARFDVFIAGYPFLLPVSSPVFLTDCVSYDHSFLVLALAYSADDMQFTRGSAVSSRVHLMSSQCDGTLHDPQLCAILFFAIKHGCSRLPVLCAGLSAFAPCLLRRFWTFLSFLLCPLTPLLRSLHIATGLNSSRGSGSLVLQPLYVSPWVAAVQLTVPQAWH